MLNISGIENHEMRILLIGITGAGKSSTGNTILGFPAFHSKISATSVTTRTQYAESNRFGKKLVVVDTPGYFDTNRTEEEIIEEFSKWYSLLFPGIHAIILVVPVNRFTDEHQKTVNFFMKVFGEDFREYLIVVFTHKDDLEEENMTVDDYVQSLNTSSSLRKLIDGSKNRYIAIGYKEKMEDRNFEVKQLLSMIEKNVGKDGKKYYSNEVFRNIQVDLKEFIEEIIRKQKDNCFNFAGTNWLDSIIKKTRKSIAYDKNNEFFLKIAYIILMSYGGTPAAVVGIAAMLWDLLKVFT